MRAARPAVAVALIRSTDRGPVPPVPVRDPDDDWDEYDDQDCGWVDVPAEVLAYEDSLDPTRMDRWGYYDATPYDDEYLALWDRHGNWSEPDHEHEWEDEMLSPCARCGDRDDLDPLGTCYWCREDDHRCTWCGLDPIVYESDRACRTCYQRLRRQTRVTNDLELRLSMLAAAFRRADLRKRRNSPT